MTLNKVRGHEKPILEITPTCFSKKRKNKDGEANRPIVPPVPPVGQHLGLSDKLRMKASPQDKRAASRDADRFTRHYKVNPREV